MATKAKSQSTTTTAAPAIAAVPTLDQLIAACRPHWKPDAELTGADIHFASAYNRRLDGTIRSFIERLSFAGCARLFDDLWRGHNALPEKGIERDISTAALGVLHRRIIDAPAASVEDIIARTTFAAKMEEEAYRYDNELEGHSTTNALRNTARDLAALAEKSAPMAALAPIPQIGARSAHSPDQAIIDTAEKWHRLEKRKHELMAMLDELREKVPTFFDRVKRHDPRGFEITQRDIESMGADFVARMVAFQPIHAQLGIGQHEDELERIHDEHSDCAEFLVNEAIPQTLQGALAIANFGLAYLAEDHLKSNPVRNDDNDWDLKHAVAARDALQLAMRLAVEHASTTTAEKGAEPFATTASEARQAQAA